MPNKIIVQIKREQGCEDLPLPKYQTEGSAGMDLCAAVEKCVTLNPGTFQLIPTGIRLSIPRGYEGQVRPRSGLALKHGIGVLNGPGTIDSDYRGVVGVILFNFSQNPFKIQRGDRIAQLVVTRFEKVVLSVTTELDSSDRDTEGFGSTGNNR
jgi:dUTP pyrophosphatase